MDHGKLTDHNGRTVDFRNVILMHDDQRRRRRSSPSRRWASAARRGTTRTTRRSTACSRRSSATGSTPSIKFANLGPGDHEPGGRQVRGRARGPACRPQGLHRAVSDGARRWLAEKGYDRLFGARPLARVIQEHLKKPLAEEVLFGKLAEWRRHGAGRRRGRGCGARSSSSPSCRPSATRCRRPAKNPCWLSEGIPPALGRAARRGACHRGLLGGPLHHRPHRLAGRSPGSTRPAWSSSWSSSSA